MELTTEQIEKAQAAYHGQLPPEELINWSDLLQKSPTLAAEVAQYNRLFAGFTAISSLNFQERMTKLEDGLSEHDDEELIEWYYRGELSLSQKAAIDKRAASDPAFAQLLATSKSLYEGLASLQSQNFRQQVETWETASGASEAKVVRMPSKSNNLRWLAVAASILIILGFGLRWYAAQNYSTPTLVAEAQVEPRTGSLMSARGSEEDPLKTLKEDIQSAYQQLEVGNYQAAQTAFTLLQDRVRKKVPEGPRQQALLDNLAWNSLLAQIGTTGMTENNRNRLTAFAKDSQFNYRDQAADY